MNKSIQAMRERRAAKAKEARALLDANQGDKFTSTVSAQVDALYNEISAIEGEITAHERMVAIENERVDSLDGLEASRRAVDPRDPANAASVAFATWLRESTEDVRGMGPNRAITDEARTIMRNTMSTTTGSEGGFTVPTLVSAQLFDAMKAFGTMRVVADVMKTANGQPLGFPTSDGTAEVGEWIAQNVTATAADPVFGSASLNVYKASSKIIAVPFELLQDSVLDIEGFVRKRLAQRLGRIGNLGFTVGTGTTQPDGVVPKASVGKVGVTGQTVLVIYDDLIDLIHSVDPAYRSSAAVFMMNDALLKVVRKIKDTAGRPIWTPSYDGGINIGLNDGNGGFKTAGQLTNDTQTVAVPFDNLLGYRVYVNNDLAGPAANAKSALFGDFSYYKVRDAMDVQMFRFTDSAYTKLGQVAFLAWARMGGNLVDTNAVKYYQHSAT